MKMKELSALCDLFTGDVLDDECKQWMVLKAELLNRNFNYGWIKKDGTAA